MSELRKILKIIDESLNSLEYIKAACLLFGIPFEDISHAPQLAQSLLDQRKKYKQALSIERRGISAILLDSEKVISGFSAAASLIEDTKQLWKNGPIKIMCSDERLISMAKQAIQDDTALTFRRDEIGKYFDFSSVLPDWAAVPDYTLIRIGGGIGFGSPEYDLFYSMCWFYDEALRLHLESQSLRKQIGSERFDNDRFFYVARHSKTMCVQTIINSFLLIEAYLNSIAHVYLHSHPGELTAGEELFLKEQARDKTGAIRQRFVSIEDKLCEWIKLMSPRKETFDKGKKPFQNFLKIKRYRDSIVHLSGKKVSTYHSIDFNLTQNTVVSLLEIVQRISEYMSADPSEVRLPWWIRKPNADGFFRLPEKYTPSLEFFHKKDSRIIPNLSDL